MQICYLQNFFNKNMSTASSQPHFNVIIRHGPYLSCGTIDHREDYLHGLMLTLRGAGHTVTLEKMQDRDMVEILVYGEVVYSCNVHDLVFGGDGKLDEKCEKACLAVATVPTVG